MPVFRWQRPMRFDKHGDILLLFRRYIHTEGHHFHVKNCRGFGQIKWPCCEKKKIVKFFLACLLAIHENLCPRKFLAIRYIHWHLMSQRFFLKCEVECCVAGEWGSYSIVTCTMPNYVALYRLHQTHSKMLPVIWEFRSTVYYIRKSHALLHPLKV